MPVPSESRYKTISAVLTKEQTRRLEGLRQAQSSELRDASFSVVLRQVVEAGLKAISSAPVSSFDTSRNEEPAA